MSTRPAARIAALVIGAVAWIGLAIQFFVLYRESGSALGTLCNILGYFTITTNILMAAVFTAIAADRPWRPSPRVVAGTVLSILLVGIIYALLLDGLLELSGGSAVANLLLHRIAPVLVPLFWLAFTPKGKLTWHDPLFWAIYPLLYLPYALLRGSATGRYAYPFLNVARLGWGAVALNAAAITVGYLLFSFALVWLDHRLAQAVSTHQSVPAQQ